MELPPINDIRRNIDAAKAWWVEQGGDPADIDNAILADNQQRMADDQLKLLQLHQERLEAAIEFTNTPLVYDTPPLDPEDELNSLTSQIETQQQQVNNLE